jgi:hypothetical protein
VTLLDFMKDWKCWNRDCGDGGTTWGGKVTVVLRGRRMTKELRVSI